MPHRYSDVYRYTHVWIAEQRDTLDSREMSIARAKDAAEPATHKAWRSILQGHSHIQYQIGDIRRALHDIGAGLSPRGKVYINTLHSQGMKWSDPRPDVSLVEAQKKLLRCLEDMRRRWAELRDAERMEAYHDYDTPF